MWPFTKKEKTIIEEDKSMEIDIDKITCVRDIVALLKFSKYRFWAKEGGIGFDDIKHLLKEVEKNG